jgi:hypothetical protein
MVRVSIFRSFVSGFVGRSATKIFTACILAGVVLLSAGGAFGGVVLYTDHNAFTSALAASTTVNFDGLAPLNTYTIIPYSWVGIYGVTVSDPYQLYAVNNSWGSGGSFGAQILVGNGIGPTTISLPGGITAVGVDGIGGSKNYATFTFSDNSTQSQTMLTPGFVGATVTNSNLNITHLTFPADSQPDSSFGGCPYMVDIIFGTTPTPEPATLSLLALGGLVLLRRRKK